MRQSRFEQLVSLYLDGEISEKELYWLRREICRSRERRELFEEYRRLHQATCKAKLDDAWVSCCGEKRTLSISPVYTTVGTMAAAVALAAAMGWQLGFISPTATPSFVQEAASLPDVVVVPSTARAKVNLARLDPVVEVNFLDENDPIFLDLDRNARLIDFESPSLISPAFQHGYAHPVSTSQHRFGAPAYQFAGLPQR